MVTHQANYEIFLSYSRRDNAPASESVAGTPPLGWVTALRDRILEDHRSFSTEPLRIFLDASEIRDMDDWWHRILGALRESKILLVCLSPNYFASPYCRWEWDEYLRRQVHRLMGAESVATVYFVEVPGSPEQGNGRWLESILRGNFTDIRPWFPAGATALQTDEVRKRVAKLGESLWDRVQRARRADGVPGNLRRQNPYFVGRQEELRQLHEQLATGAVGLVTAVHGLGGQGKTELAVAYAHGWADCYPAGLWVLGAEKKAELLPLIGELAYAPELGYRPTDAERNDPALLGRAVLAELGRRAQAARDRDPDGRAAVLLILDNVSETALLSKGQLATLPRADWLRIIATTRLDAARLDPSGKSLAHIAVDSLSEEDALALVRDHQDPRDAQGRPLGAVPGADPLQFVPRFASPAEEAAGREIVRELGGFTLAVEQVAVYLGLHPEIAPSAYLAGLRARGLPSVDALARHADVRDQLLHQGKQLAVILEATLGLLDAPVRAALDFAALLPSDAVPWPWLKALVTARHPELAQFAPDEPDPWVAVRRRLEGLRLLTPGDHPELARVHRLVAAHLAQNTAATERARSEIVAHLTARATAIYYMKTAPADWELDTLVVAVPIFLAGDATARDLAHIAMFLSAQIIAYRGLPPAKGLLAATHPFFQRLAKADPSNADWQHYLCASHQLIGNVLLPQGDLAGALQSYRASVEVAERLPKASLSNADRQRDLCISNAKIGDVLLAQGDLAGALQAYREAMGVAERPAKAVPWNANWQRNLSMCHNKIGDVLLAQGDLAGALQAYRESMGVFERLAKADSRDAGRQHDLSVSQDKIGDVLLAQGDLAGALQAYRESMGVRERLAKADPSNAGWQRDLSVSHSHIGDVLLAQVDLAGALQAYREAMGVAERLAKADPSNGDLQHGVLVSNGKTGDVLRAQGDLAGALQAYRESMGVAERLAKADPSNAGWQCNLSVSQERIGDVLLAQGDLAGALQAYRESMGVAERLAKADPSNAGWQCNLSVSQNRVGDVLLAQGDLAGTLQAYRESMGVRERLALSDPSNADWQRDLVVSFSKMANLSETSGHGDAQAWWRKAYAQLDGMKQRGIMLPTDEQNLQALQAKLGAVAVPFVWETDAANAPSPEEEQPRSPAQDAVPTAIAALKDGRVQDALDALRPLVFPGDGVVMDQDAPLEARLAFLSALWLSNNVEAIAQHLPSFPEQDDPRVAALDRALADWQRGLTWAQRSGLKKKPPLPDVSWS